MVIIGVLARTQLEKGITHDRSVSHLDLRGL